MTPREKRAVSSLASIYALRMMGLFMILPVFALYAQDLEGVTPFLVGVAIGAYGLTQAILAIPFGMWSDRIGRKRVITIGLLIFAAGSVIAAMADSIYGVILGRAIQGSGAIAAAIMALTSDLTREEHRLKAMAVIGMSIGVSFAISLVLGPVLDRWIGVDGIFWLTAVLALGGIVLLHSQVPTPVHSGLHRDTMPVPALFASVLRDTQLQRLNFGILSLHMMLTATFVVMPLALQDIAGLDKAHHWYIYLPVLLFGLFLMVPFIIIAESKRKMKQVFVGAIIALVVAELSLVFWHSSVMSIITALLIFFIAFNVLEASLPSLVAKEVTPDRKGTAMGVYSTAQFLGAFIGGALGGWLHGKYGIGAVFMMCALVAFVWFFVAATMRNPRYLSSYLVRVGPVDAKRAEELAIAMTAVTGVAEALVIPEDGVAYLKVDLHALDKSEILKFAVPDEA
ncbi:MAG: MFS transporter [Pseudomonadota bacterium]